tara:strand:- start:1199 stop:1408 length:210 start_codon:yes stop_codon:yes gene_type:complete
MLKSTELNYPSVETWFIGWDNDREEIKAYGSVLPTQCMISPWDEMDYFTNEAEWLEVLLENGINPFQED